AGHRYPGLSVGQRGYRDGTCGQKPRERRERPRAVWVRLEAVTSTRRRSWNMTTKSRICSMAGIAIAGSLAFGVTGASAQAIYVDSYADPYSVAVAPGSVYVPGGVYVRPASVAAPPPIVSPR